MSYQDQAADRILPGAGTAITAGSDVAGTAVDLSAFLEQIVSLKFAGKTHIRAAGSAVLAQGVTTTDMWLAADEMQDFKVVPGKTFLAGYGIGAAHAGVVVVTSR